jgi:predicted RNase H-related nuclease YkuK (DUF458 family)
MTHIFKSLGTEQVIDLIPYLKSKLATRNDIEVYVGCDSQNKAEETVYACVIVLHYGRQGGHVLYSVSRIPRIKERFIKLWKEVEYSLEVAEYLRSQSIEATFIDIDLNPDPRWGSNNVLRSATGLCESFGFRVRYKPYAISATYIADKICNRKLKKKKVEA